MTFIEEYFTDSNLICPLLNDIDWPKAASLQKCHEVFLILVPIKYDIFVIILYRRFFSDGFSQNENCFKLVL